MNTKKIWLDEYRTIPSKRCMQVDVIIADDGTRMFPNTVRNRIRLAALEHRGGPISIKDIAEILGVTRSCVYMRLSDKRRWPNTDMRKLEAWLGSKVFE